MKKTILTITITIVILLSNTYLYKYFKTKENQKYQTILKEFENALIWELDVTDIAQKKCEPNVNKKGITTSKYLISQGYLKKEKMLDIDNKSYCKAYAKIFDTKDCGVDYKLYLKCKNYKTNGDIDWN